MASNYIQDHNRLFGDLTAALSRDLARLSSEANGGRSILFVYPPEDEEKYIEEAKKRYTDGYEFIDIRELFTEFVDSKGLDKFKKACYNHNTKLKQERVTKMIKYVHVPEKNKTIAVLEKQLLHQTSYL